MPRLFDHSPLVIAIDGPAASGKSTVALKLARRLGLAILDSGAMYRAVTLVALEAGTNMQDEEGLRKAAERVREDYRVVCPEVGSPRFFLGPRDITDSIRSPLVGSAVSLVSIVETVRSEMVELQRGMVAGKGAVVEGRDIGTIVFPDAPLKVYLDASFEERVRRRYLELREKRIPVEKGPVRSEIEKRDLIDSSRERSPLKVAEGALVIDTTSMTVEDVVLSIVGEARRRGLL